MNECPHHIETIRCAHFGERSAILVRDEHFPFSIAVTYDQAHRGSVMSPIPEPTIENWERFCAEWLRTEGMHR